MCHITDSQIQANGKVIAKALESIAKLVPDPNLATDLHKAAVALLDATANWSSTSNKALFDDAALAVEAVLAEIPQTAAFAPFVAIAVAALDILMANIGTAPAPITPAAVKATLARIDALPPNPWRGKAEIVHHHMHSLYQDFVDAWNAARAKQPALGIAKL